MKARKTTKFQEDLLDFTDIPLGPFFLSQAISYYTGVLLDDPEETRKEIGHTSIVDPDYWMDLAHKARKLYLDED
jgi:hypothetical protein